ncbi:hypothetical protein THIOSC13_1680003 [uncultured Thiomicrorhabdus sp.]
MRKDPPIDAVIFNFLDSIKNECVILNDVDGIRKANNKLFTSTFNDPNNHYTDYLCFQRQGVYPPNHQ